MAENKILTTIGSIITFKASGGTVAWTPTSLASGAGRASAQYDFGTGPVGDLWACRCQIVPGGTRVVGEVGRLYAKWGNGSTDDTSDGTSDAVVSASDKLRNLAQLASLQIDKNAADKMCTAVFPFYRLDRYLQWVAWNATANSWSGTSTDFLIEMWPLVAAVQPLA